MATGIEAKILEGLLAHLATLTLSPTMDVAWPNVDFTPGEAGYLGVAHLPSTTEQLELGDTGDNRFRGIFQVSVFWPKGEGEIDAQERAASVSEHFKRGTSITQDSQVIRIARPPEVAPAVYDDLFVQIPVSIIYQADAANP